MIELNQMYGKEKKDTEDKKSPSIQEIVQVNISKTSGTRGKINWVGAAD